MACCLTAPNHYLNQCWLIISMVQWHSHEGSFTRDTSATDNKNQLENYSSKFTVNLPGANELSDPNLNPWRVIAWTSSWLTHGQLHGHTDEGNDNTWRPKLALGKNTSLNYISGSMDGAGPMHAIRKNLLIFPVNSWMHSLLSLMTRCAGEHRVMWLDIRPSLIFVIRTLHDCPSQMNENLLISNSKLTSDSELIWWR